MLCLQCPCKRPKGTGDWLKLWCHRSSTCSRAALRRSPCRFLTPVHRSPFTYPQDNDVILCDGPCNCAFHQKCLDPPLDVSTLPEDEGWLCPACDCKVRQKMLAESAERPALPVSLLDPWL